jgi:hypothetical protein
MHDLLDESTTDRLTNQLGNIFIQDAQFSQLDNSRDHCPGGLGRHYGNSGPSGKIGN